MQLLSPVSLLWLASVPVLIWLWRLQATHRRLRISSLVPFEHLLERQAKRRTRLVINWLFWLQLAALIGVTVALTQPMFLHRSAKLILIILDTSASMDATSRGSRAFERAQRSLVSRLARKPPRTQVMVMATAPVTALTEQPTSDTVAVSRAIQSARVSHLGGNLATTVRLGRALLSREPDELWIATDEAQPSQALSASVRWISVGNSLPNVALLGADSQGSLCHPADTPLMATLHNFSDEVVSTTLTVRQDRRVLAKETAALAPGARATLPLALSASAQGFVELELSAPHDGLALDNRAWVQLRQGPRLPIVVRVQEETLHTTVSHWLKACEALQWTTDPPASIPYLLVTDHDLNPATEPAAILRFDLPSSSPLESTYWLASPKHPLNAYLNSLEMVPTALSVSSERIVSGTPVISALVQGRQVPLVIADEREGHRIVSLLFDPSNSPTFIPVVLAFFNSLRWLMGSQEALTTGTPLMLSGLQQGTVRVVRPDRTSDIEEAVRGVLQYDSTTHAGVYRVVQGSREERFAINFFDPVESNLRERSSTWASMIVEEPPAAQRPKAKMPLANLLMMLLLALLLVEWVIYSLNSQSFRAQGSVK